VRSTRRNRPPEIGPLLGAELFVELVWCSATEPSILEPEEIAAILRELEGIEPVRTAFLIAAIMGIRRGELFGLRWADVDF
jgi:integrase